jgi:hypothetical protein
MKLLCASFFTIVLASSAVAGERMVTIDKQGPAPTEQWFGDREWQVDIFGQYTDGNGPDHAGIVREHGWGGGVGVNYFFTRNWGVGVDAVYLNAKEAPALSKDNDREDTYNFSASVIYRFPMESSHLAPYVYVGGGASIDGEAWATAHGGLGLEYRIKPQKFGVFIDSRYTYYGDRFGNGDQGNISARAGFRIIF